MKPRGLRPVCTCSHNCDKLGSKVPIWREATDVGLLVLEVASCDALLCTQEIRVLRGEHGLQSAKGQGDVAQTYFPGLQPRKTTNTPGKHAFVESCCRARDKNVTCQLPSPGLAQDCPTQRPTHLYTPFFFFFLKNQVSLSKYGYHWVYKDRKLRRSKFEPRMCHKAQPMGTSSESLWLTGFVPHIPLHSLKFS